MLNLELDAIYCGDCIDVLREMPADTVHACVTSPPYWKLRDYHIKGQIGMERTPEEYVAKIVSVFEEVKRVLRPDGTLWLNLGDSYAATGRNRTHEQATAKSTIAGSTRNQSSILKQQSKITSGLKPKDLVGIPWRVAFALQAAGWYLRSDIIWAKPNPMPESVTDRPTRSHEYLFLLSKSKQYYYDADAIREPSANRVTKIPDGWDTETGSHGNIHHKGRDRGISTEEYFSRRNDRTEESDFTRRDKQRGHLRKHAGFNERWDNMNHEEQAQNGRNKRDVWFVTPFPFHEAHFATFPPKLIEPCVLAGCPAGGIVLDPFMGAGTTALVALKLGRHFVGIELNADYIDIARRRIAPEIAQTRLAL